jgi:hypothetical protein
VFGGGGRASPQLARDAELHDEVPAQRRPSSADPNLGYAVGLYSASCINQGGRERREGGEEGGGGEENQKSIISATENPIDSSIMTLKALGNPSGNEQKLIINVMGNPID